MLYGGPKDVESIEKKTLSVGAGYTYLAASLRSKPPVVRLTPSATDLYAPHIFAQISLCEVFHI
jgi:hypothetical protein